ncbi:hypothetical protein [Lentibacillus salicampi]|uniref:Uncharacterized protein n=1 Tax=Lentibacillus salicampi TaxID=175306 RepID=A0A4Y9A950_9BACI|nr:hypothetical protein [Lentibacillus salicampi]TFJ92333.1 hypothetical protein E4U82_12820 [Lentibacillus salicampi]
MEKDDIEQKVIEGYQQDEKMMILVYAQWCINNDLDPEALYSHAYPNQMNNGSLREALELTVSKQESEAIPDQTVLNVLQLFGNEDLAFVVQEQIVDKAEKSSDKSKNTAD